MEVNFLRAYKWYYGEEKITLAKFNEIAEARHKAEDPDYKKVLKYYLPIACGEFRDFFPRNKTIPYLYPKITTIKLN